MSHPDPSAVLAAVARLVAENPSLTDVVSRLAVLLREGVAFDQLFVLRLDRPESLVAYAATPANVLTGPRNAYAMSRDGLFFRAAARQNTAKTPHQAVIGQAIVATLLVVGISGAAPLIGGRVAGVLATFPVYASVLATFAHRLRGPGDGIAVLRGMVTGLLGFSTFFLVLAEALATTSIPVAFGLAVASGLAVQGLTVLPLLGLARRGAGPPPAVEIGPLT